MPSKSDIIISDDNASNIFTVGELINHVWESVKARNDISKEVVNVRIKEILQEISGLEIHEIKETSSIAKDLGIS